MEILRDCLDWRPKKVMPFVNDNNKMATLFLVF